jgi:hypothetical protein
MRRSEPEQIEAGDIFGHRFPTSSDPRQAHPGLVLSVLEGSARKRALEQNGKDDFANATLCVVLMISHAQPKPGEFGQLVTLEHRSGCLLDRSRDVFVCFRHFDIAFLPRQAVKIKSVNGAYLGRMPADGVKHYRAQFVAVQDYLKGKSFKPPEGVFVR